MTEPLVSVIMPTYNQARWLPAALASLEAQTFRDFELIVIDDGSTDETGGIIGRATERPWQAAGRFIVAFHGSNFGAAAAINTGTALSRGRYRTWVSSDNVMAPEWLTSLIIVTGLTVVTELRSVGAAYGGFNYCAPGEPPRYLFTPWAPNRQIEREDCYYGPAFLMRSDVWDEAGPHRGAISHDLDHWLRVEEVCARRGLAIVGVDAPLCDYNAHPERSTVARRHLYDAPHWRAEARRRRGLA